MADLAESFGKGMQLALQLDNAATMRQVRQAQMQELALKLLDHQNKLAMGEQFSNPDVMQSFLGQFPESHRPFVEAAARTGNYDWAEKTPKMPLTPKYMNLAEGGQIVNPDTREVVMQGNPKADRYGNPIGLDPKTFAPVYKHPATGATITIGDNGEVSPYKVTKQLKSVTEPAPFIQTVPGYQTPDTGQPVFYDAKKGPPNVGRGGKPLQKTPSESDISEARKTIGITAIIDELRGAYNTAEKSLPQTPGERMNPLQYAVRQGKVFSQSDPALTNAQNLSAGFLAKFARAAGEVGTLTEGDISRAKQLVPTINDTKAVREAKLRGAEQLYNEIYKRGKRQPQPLGPYNQGTGNKIGRFIVEEE